MQDSELYPYVTADVAIEKTTLASLSESSDAAAFHRLTASPSELSPLPR